MAQGLQCFDSAGALVLDVTDRLTRILGEFTTTTANGSITDANLTSGTPWFFQVTEENPFNAICTITISGQTITWTFSSYGVKTAQTFRYGVF
ncbi:hypothetical protein SOV_50780 [Sporomusa ovata DSM 2662]|uniref:Uncharacterized protein n=1 Tax=Sporomusa ovata TaxID=2378 RepID=A0A0U1L183_9FIRM|nr:hypothetical protein [Sporomusa ovata]EQB27451.1 hypothetical protein SOV_2c03470 [Sporomusa ovata DSM 2662]CQR73295.1 hypothetical protein SpAn4DRAFT_2527 [Sporomusa ovata]